MASTLESRAQHRTLDPLAALKVPLDSSSSDHSNRNTSGSRYSVSSVCFLPSNGNNHVSDSSDSSDDEEPSFRCRTLMQQEQSNDGDITAGARETAAAISLSGTRLVSCHTNGDAFVWDLGRRRIVSNFCERRGQGMALRRVGGESSNNIFYQTRDSLGTVSIHDVSTTDVVTTFETHSLSFCSAAPCAGNGSLLVLPTENRFYASVRDIRVPPVARPIVQFHGAGLDDASTDDEDKHGMMMSLAMSEAKEHTGKPIVVCGMESGQVFFHDLRIIGRSIHEEKDFEGSESAFCSIKLGNDPVLGVDLASSSSVSPTEKRSFVSIAGMAGHAADLSELPMEERGTVAVMKASFSATNDETPVSSTVRLRARVPTCKIGGPNESFRGGKPGVGVCRFRPDGRVFGVGGWDRRVRIFDRTGNAEPLAILKGHADSITALDWAPDSQTNGFLASGAGDGRIYIWRCFPSYPS